MTSTVRSPATAPGALPLLGHGLRMKKRPGPFLLSLQSGEPVIAIRLGRTPMYVVNDPGLIRRLLRDPVTFDRGGPVTERFRLMFGNGLGISGGEFHRGQRALIQPAFGHDRIVGYAEQMTGLVATKTDSWRDGQRLRMDKELDELALATVTQAIFAPDTALDRARFMAATAVVLGGLYRRVTDATGLLSRLPTPANRRYRESEDYLRRSINEVIGDYRSTGVDHGDLLSLMLFAERDDGRPAMDDRQLHDEVMTFFIAGSNTIGNTLAWALHEIAAHPGIERRLHEEVDSVLAGRPARHRDLDRLGYTRRILTETLRRWTQGLFLSRTTTKETELGGYRLPAGASVLYSFHALNHNPAIHDEPERFDPDRWLPERAKAIPKGAFMPFGMGVHGCIGETFSWAEMVIALATIAARWRLVPVPGHRPRPVPAMTMPVDALPMTVHRRTPA
jgi:cytochrome P450